MSERKYGNDGLSAADKALERFTELMIDKIRNLQGDWKKPWFAPGVTQPPRNLSGRPYNGGNSLMLMLQAEKMGYDVPVWGTFDRISGMNYIKDKHGNVFQARDAALKAAAADLPGVHAGDAADVDTGAGGLHKPLHLQVADGVEHL